MSRRASVPAVEPVAMSTPVVEEIVGGLELVPEGRLDEHHARALDERIRLTAGTVRDRLTRVATLVEQAKAGEVWDVLGFASWTAYLADALGGQLHLPAGERRELVALLAGEGMSTRAMAPIVGASPRTVARDVETLDLPGVPDGTPAQVTGLDGKRYTKPAKAEPVVHGIVENMSILCGVELAGLQQRTGERATVSYSSDEVTCQKCRSLVPAWKARRAAATMATATQKTLDGIAALRAEHEQAKAEHAAKMEQLTIEGTEPERMVPTLPGLGVAQQRPVKVLQDWYGAFCDWWKHPGPMGSKRVEVAEDAYRAGWQAALASIDRAEAS